MLMTDEEPPVYVLEGSKRLDAERFTLVCFDIHRGRGKKAVYRALWRRQEQIDGRTYAYPGLLDKGAIRLGQSVFAFPPDLAGGLISVSRTAWCTPPGKPCGGGSGGFGPFCPQNPGTARAMIESVP